MKIARVLLANQPRLLRERVLAAIANQPDIHHALQPDGTNAEEFARGAARQTPVCADPPASPALVSVESIFQGVYFLT
jgi:hypothetical protein